MTFWEHLDDLRSCLIRIGLVVLGLTVVAFCLKPWLFALILAPSHGDFITYRLLSVQMDDLHFINTGLATQFSLHMAASFGAGIAVGSPWVLRELFGFVKPALYRRERRYALRITIAAYVMFVVGAAINYLAIFPMMVHFFGDYRVSAEVPNLIAIDSYVEALLSSTLIMGVVFELPAVCWLLGRFGLISAEWMRRYRRHALVAVMIAAAVITPPDPMSMCLVVLPIYLLYELSIFLVRKQNKGNDNYVTEN